MFCQPAALRVVCTRQAAHQLGRSVYATTAARRFMSLRPLSRLARKPTPVDFVLPLAALAAGGAAVTLALAEEADSNNDVFDVVRSRDVKRLKHLLHNGHHVDQRHRLGWTPLHLAAAIGSPEVCKTLLELGASVDAKDTYKGFPRTSPSFQTRKNEFSSNIHPSASTAGFTALHYAMLMDNEAVVSVLMKHEADPSIRDNAVTLVQGHLASEYTSSPEMEKLFRQYTTAYIETAVQRAEAREEEARRRRRLYPLEKRLKKYIVGQEGAIMAASAAIRRRENKWHDEDHPLVFLFLGASGVGKTTLAKRIAQYLHGDDDAPPSQHPKGFIRLDMSEFQEKHEVSKLIGSPAGYVGHDEGGMLTNQLRETPNAVVLLDEVEKAHSDVLTVLLQLFDEGRLTDGKGETVDCKDAIFIMTSNVASDAISEFAAQLRSQAEETQKGDELFDLPQEFKEQTIRPILKHHFVRNEFLGRIDEMVYFTPFTAAEQKQLIEMELQKWSRKASERHSIKLKWSTAVVDLLLDDYDLHYGARSLQHTIDRRVINKIAAAHEKGEITRGASVDVQVENNDIKLNISKSKFW